MDGHPQVGASKTDLSKNAPPHREKDIKKCGKWIFQVTPEKTRNPGVTNKYLFGYYG